jgi:hypothetical protein
MGRAVTLILIVSFHINTLSTNIRRGARFFNYLITAQIPDPSHPFWIRACLQNFHTGGRGGHMPNTVIYIKNSDHPIYLRHRRKLNKKDRGTYDGGV